MTTDQSHPLLAAAYDPATALVERVLAPHREYLAADLSGAVLDVGTGTGAMLPYLAAEDVTVVHAVDPDPHMRRRAARRAADLDVDVRIDDASAESLPYAADQFDAAVVGMALCTIPDPEAALSELARVLRPGAELRALEHVAADGLRARVQALASPLWKRIAGGCHLTRRTGAVLAGREVFDVLELRRLPIGVLPVRPFVRARLRRRAVD